MLVVPWGRKRVRRLVGDRAHIERGTPDRSHPRVAVIAHWSGRARVTRSVCELVSQLQASDYLVVACSACGAGTELEWGDGIDLDGLVVIRKPNVGYDFGSWSIALRMLPWIPEAKRVILANDSMAGPFAPLRPLLDQFDETAADVWGLTDTSQFEPHLQSYFLGFRNSVLASTPVRRFWSGIRDEREKIRIILRSEIGLSRLLRDEGFVQMPAYPQERYVESGENPVIVGWRRLLEHGFPFLKREILRDPSVAPDGEVAPAVVARLFGADVGAWVDDLDRAAV